MAYAKAEKEAITAVQAVALPVPSQDSGVSEKKR
jgi:hypothetical protein